VRKGRFCRGFADFGVQNVVYCVVNRGGFVVKTWLETAANSMAKIFQLLRFIFSAMRLEKGMGYR
jgi:hypothetical protein